jgi:hypothetical protein
MHPCSWVSNHRFMLEDMHNSLATFKPPKFCRLMQTRAAIPSHENRLDKLYYGCLKSKVMNGKKTLSWYNMTADMISYDSITLNE